MIRYIFVTNLGIFFFSTPFSIGTGNHISSFLLFLLGAKEIDIAATLEHVRDQRAGMVKTKVRQLPAVLCYATFDSVDIIHL